MKECSAFVFLLLFQSVVMVVHQPDHSLNDTHLNCAECYGIRNNRRPRSNRVLNITDENSERYPQEHIGLSRHHIIPYPTLRAFYNRVIRVDPSDFTHLFENVLVVGAQHVGQDLRPYRNLILSRREPLPEDLPDILQNHIRNNLNQINQENLAREVYVWLQFNIFVGPDPQFRADDPGSGRYSGFEENAHVIVGELRLAQLRRMYNHMNEYIDSRPINVRDLIDEMGNLLRTTPLPYDFNPMQWRVRTDPHETRRFAIATAQIRSDRRYRTVEPRDLCTGGQIDFHRLHPRSRRDTKPYCLVQDKGAIYDPCCIKSLDLLRTLIDEGILFLNGDGLTFNTNEIPEQPQIKSPDCKIAGHGATGLLGGAAAGALSCLGSGGVLLPGLGWVACSVGSAMYALGGFAVTTGIAIARCKS